MLRGCCLDLDPALLGYPEAVIVRTKPMPGQLPAIIELARKTPRIVECQRITREDCFSCARTSKVSTCSILCSTRSWRSARQRRRLSSRLPWRCGRCPYSVEAPWRTWHSSVPKPQDTTALAASVVSENLFGQLIRLSLDTVQPFRCEWEMYERGRQSTQAVPPFCEYLERGFHSTVFDAALGLHFQAASTRPRRVASLGHMGRGPRARRADAVRHLHRMGAISHQSGPRPCAARAFFDFTVWANLAHGVLMTVQMAFSHHDAWKLLTDVPWILGLSAGTKTQTSPCVMAWLPTTADSALDRFLSPRRG